MKNPLPASALLCVALMSCVGLAGTLPAAAQANVVQGAVSAADQSAVETLMATMQIDQVIEVLRLEGIDYGTSIEDEMFPERGGPAWRATVADIYNPDAMKSAFGEKLVVGLAGKGPAVARMTEFFASDLGQRVLGLEIEARRALRDEDAEAAAQLAWNDLSAVGGARVDLLQQFVAANDLVDSNVMGALNSNLAFYQGLASTGAFGGEMTEDQMLSDVWAQESEIRQQTEDWVYPYINLAYSSLTDEELRAYVEFSASEAGKQLNSALFAAFDAVFVPISKSLGAAAAQQLKGQDI